MKVNTKIASTILQKYNTFLFDCDGVIWHEEHLIPGAKELINSLRKKDKKIFFVTNNPTKSRQSFSKKFEEFGINVNKDEIFGAGYATAQYVSKLLENKLEHNVVVMGSDGLMEELKDLSINCKLLENNIEEIANAKADVIIFSLDIDLNYKKYGAMHRCLLANVNKDCHFVTTDDDFSYPVKGHSLPGTGAILRFLVSSTGREPVVVGKPSPLMFEMIKEKIENHDHNSIDLDQILMVGDRMDSDILFSKNCKIDSLLVLSGITKPSDLPNYHYQPNYIADSVFDLAKP